MNDKVIEENIIHEDEQEINIDDYDETRITFLNLTKFALSYAGVFVGGVALGVGLGGDLEGPQKGATIIASGTLTAFSLVKSIKYTRLMLGLEKKGKTKKLELK